MNAMVLAAGLGMRMRPITETMPKALVQVAGKPLIDYALEALEETGAERAVVNVHYLADQVRRHLASRRGIEASISDETSSLLDSGGGIVRALPLLGKGSFYILNADTFWIEDETAPASNLVSLARAYDPQRMDFLLMVADPEQATGHTGAGDFLVGDDGRLTRYKGNGKAVIYAGAIVCHPRVFAGAPDGPFSLNVLFDRAIADGRLFGRRMQGHWLTVGTPAAIPEAEAVIARLQAFEKAG
jgi:MurNAc alpha-1-phosphate uridylyltransferase